MARLAMFFDRDGVINIAPPLGEYVTTPEQFRLRPGAAEAIAAANAAGYLVIVVTNQRGVALGLMTLADLDAVHEKMRRELAAAGAHVDDIFVCTHDRDANCECRKPRPGMILAAARKWNIDLARSFVLGDSERDIEAGERAGCRTVRITEDYGPLEAVRDILAGKR